MLGPSLLFGCLIEFSLPKDSRVRDSDLLTRNYIERGRGDWSVNYDTKVHYLNTLYQQKFTSR